MKHEMGSGGQCICTKCAMHIPHRQGVPCQDEKCPKCGGKMLREGSHHHKLFKEKHKIL